MIGKLWCLRSFGDCEVVVIEWLSVMVNLLLWLCGCGDGVVVATVWLWCFSDSVQCVAVVILWCL